MKANELTKIKVGDKVVCTTEKGFYRACNVFSKPRIDEVYEITEVVESRYFVLKGFDQNDLWHSNNFSRVKRLSEVLAENLIESIVNERPDNERIFRTDAKF